MRYGADKVGLLPISCYRSKARHFCHDTIAEGAEVAQFRFARQHLAMRCGPDESTSEPDDSHQFCYRDKELPEWLTNERTQRPTAR